MPSPQQPDPADAIGTARTLAASLDGMAGELKAVNDNSVKRDADLHRQGRRTRLGLAVDIVLTIIIALLAWQNSSTSSRVSSADARSAAATAEANANRTSSIAACQSTNVARAENEQLWTYTLTLFAPRPGETAAEKAQGEKVLAELRAHVVHAFMPRDCVAIYSPKGGGHG